jgi:hypothetical protein
LGISGEVKRGRSGVSPVSTTKRNSMAKRKSLDEVKAEILDGSAPVVPSRDFAREMAVGQRLPMMHSEQFEKLAEMLKPLGVTFNLKPVRTGEYEAGHKPFAYKATMSSATFVVDLQ